MSRTDAINACLPQTQCGKCGYAGCAPYAQAIASGEAPINQCPPGGLTTLHALADLLDQPVTTLNPANGKLHDMKLAEIREAECIGCTKCLQVCPVDAIIGAGKQMHVVISEACTGCELCLPPCPVDCIDLTPAPHHPLMEIDLEERAKHIDQNRRRFAWHEVRLDKQKAKKRQADQSALPDVKAAAEASEADNMQDEIQAAIARSRARKRQRQS